MSFAVAKNIVMPGYGANLQRGNVFLRGRYLRKGGLIGTGLSEVDP